MWWVGLSVAILLVNNPTALAYLDLSHPCHFFHALYDYDYTGYTGSSTCTVIENQRVHNQTLALPESCHPIYNIYNQKLWIGIYLRSRMPGGKKQKQAGRLKRGGRSGERAVCEELGDTKWRVSLMMVMMLMMLTATIRPPCPSRGLSHSKTASEQARGGVVNCEVSRDWRFRPPANTLLMQAGLQQAGVSFRD